MCGVLGVCGISCVGCFVHVCGDGGDGGVDVGVCMVLACGDVLGW